MSGMVSRQEAAAAFNAAAKELGMRGKELGDFSFALSNLSVAELEVFPIGADSESIVQFMRRAKAARNGGGGGGGGGTSGDGQHLAWVGVPLMVLALVVGRGVSHTGIDEIKQYTKKFIARNDVALATAYHGVRGVGLVASVGLGVVAAVRAFVKRLKVQPAPAGGVLPDTGTSTTGQVDASEDG